MTIRKPSSLIVLVSIACGEPTSIDSTPASDSSSTSTTGLPAAEREPASSEDGTTEPASTFLGNPDLGESSECETWLQNCPTGYKCNPYASSGGSWDRARCFPVVDDPDEVGEPCVVEGSLSGGYDTCELGSWCWDVDPETHVGECADFCLGDPSSLRCADPDMRCGGHRFFPQCVELCCPLEQNCDPSEACYPDGHGFFCSKNANPDGGEYGSACEFLNVCAPGLFCANPDITLDCQPGAAGCCQPFCEVGSDDCAAYNPQYECIPWYGEEPAPPGYELTGLCVAPE